MKRSIAVVLVAVPLAFVMLGIESRLSFAQTKAGPVGVLNTQKTELTVQFPSAPAVKVTLNASEVEKVIEMLAQMRADMNPPRPMADPVPGSTINVATAGRWYIQPAGADIDLDVLHPGYGWVGILLDRESMEEMNRTLTRYIHPVVIRARHPSKRE